jgi:signal peptidase I
MKKKGINKLFKDTWYFIWEDNSIWSWIVNIILAFILIKFIVYPGLGFALYTSHPVVAVVSSSMEHKTVLSCLDREFQLSPVYSCDVEELRMCGNSYEKKTSFSFDRYWEECGGWYKDKAISKEQFYEFPFRNGFNKGDIMILRGLNAEDVKNGDVIVFSSIRSDPIIHRVVSKTVDGELLFQTKGDNNQASIESNLLDETKITEDAIIGKAVFRIPFLGYIKIWFVDILQLFNHLLRG